MVSPVWECVRPSVRPFLFLQYFCLDFGQGIEEGVIRHAGYSKKYLINFQGVLQAVRMPGSTAQVAGNPADGIEIFWVIWIASEKLVGRCHFGRTGIPVSGARSGFRRPGRVFGRKKTLQWPLGCLMEPDPVRLEVQMCWSGHG